ncbi:methyl-accepting chemotaxis protein [Rhizobium leguminosarum]|nr:methyl-accepting chemotaxis protein [Rhizobium leguminosarum]MBY5908635.1 methyl-accepting chemotaxis protein [Rhizobium leguminosarum]
MTNSAARKSLSASQRLSTLDGAAFPGFGTMIGAGWYEALRQIGEDVLRIHEHVKSIVTSAREQSVGLNEINTSISQMDQVTQTKAVGHRLAIDAANLMQLVMQFKTGEGMSARQTPREGPAASHSRPSPARSLIGKIAVAFNGGTAAKVIASPVGDNWEEF